MGFAAREVHAAFDNSDMHNSHKWDRADMAIPQSRAVSGAAHSAAAAVTCSAMNFSASSAAMQPLPAAVTAWR